MFHVSVEVIGLCMGGGVLISRALIWLNFYDIVGSKSVIFPASSLSRCKRGGRRSRVQSPRLFVLKCKCCNSECNSEMIIDKQVPVPQTVEEA